MPPTKQELALCAFCKGPLFSGGFYSTGMARQPRLQQLCLLGTAHPELCFCIPEVQQRRQHLSACITSNVTKDQVWGTRSVFDWLLCWFLFDALQSGLSVAQSWAWRAALTRLLCVFFFRFKEDPHHYESGLFYSWGGAASVLYCRNRKCVNVAVVWMYLCCPEIEGKH